MKPAASRGFGTKAIFGANFVSTSPNAPPTSKLPLTSRHLDSAPVVVTANVRKPHAQAPPSKTLADSSQDIDVPDAMPWYNGETAHNYTMHLLALSGSDAFVDDSDHVADAKKQESQKVSNFSKLKSVVVASSFVNKAFTAAKKPFQVFKSDNPKALASFKELSALSEEEKLLYPSWMTEGDIQTRKFLAQKIVANRNRLRGLLIRADEMMGTDDLRETLAKKYGLNEATYTEVADMVSNNRTKVKNVFDDIHALSQEQQAVLQEVQRALASTTTDLNFEITNLEDRLDDLQEDSLLQDAERSLGHAKSMRIKLSTSHSRFLDQAVERLTTKMPQLIKSKHMEQDLVLAADSLETMRKTVHECKSITAKAQKEAQEKNEALKLCQKELSEVCKDRDRLMKVEKELRSNVDMWREKFYQSDRDLKMEIQRGEEAERQHAAILEITLRNSQKVVEDRIAATARSHEDQLRKLNTILFQLEQDLLYEKRLRDPDAVLKNADNLSTQNNAAKPSSIVQQLEDSQSENEALQRTVDRLIFEVNSASDEKDSLERSNAALTLQNKAHVDASSSLMAEKAAKESEMQVRCDTMTLFIEEFKSKIERNQVERDEFQKTISEAQQEISMLKSQSLSTQFTKHEHAIMTVQEKGSTHSVATQTLTVVGTGISTPKMETTQSEIKSETEKSTDSIVQLKKDGVMSTPSGVQAPAVIKIFCGTQTDVPYPSFSHDSARLAIDCTRPECVVKVKEIQQLKELAIANSNSEAQEAASKLANQLAIRDREHKTASQKVKKEMDIKLEIEKESVSKARKLHEQFRGAVKKKIEATIMEIKKMKRIGDFSNVGEIELHLNDVYIGATESFDSFQAEIDARNQEPSQSIESGQGESVAIGNDNIVDGSQLSGSSSSKEANSSMTKNSKFGAASKAIMFTMAASKVLNSFGGNSGDDIASDCSLPAVSVSMEDLKTTAERFIYSTQQFISGCSFGVNSSSVSLERAQKKLSFCVEHFRMNRKASSDSIFQLNLELKDFKQKYEDSQMVIKSQTTSLVRAERDCRFLAQRLSKHEVVEKSDIFEQGQVEDGSHLPNGAAKKALKNSSSNSKLSAASKAAIFIKTAGKGAIDTSKNFSKSVAIDSGNSHETVASSTFQKPEGFISAADSLHPENLNLAICSESSDAHIDNVQADMLPQCTNLNVASSSVNDDSDLKASSTMKRDNVVNGSAEGDRKGSRRHLDELKLSTVSCIYQESSNAPPLLDYATQVELGSLRSAHKSHEAKIRKLEHMLEDRQDQLQHFTVMMEASTRDQIRARNHAINLSLEVHSERSKVESQLECNAELLRRIAVLEQKSKAENQALVAARVQESVHVSKLQDLTNKMHSFYQRCEQYVQEERAPLVSLFFEFWLRLSLLRKDIGLILSLNSSESCNFKSSELDLSNYSSHDSSMFVASFSEMLADKSLSQLRDEIIRKFGLCCSDIADSVRAQAIRHQPVTEKKEESKILPPAPLSTQHPDTVLSSVSKDSKYNVSLAAPSQFFHKQLLPSIAPKFKSQSFESMSIDDALHRNSDDIIDKLTSKLTKNSIVKDTEVTKKLLNSWAKLAPAGFSALRPENVQKQMLMTQNISNLLPPPAAARAWKAPSLLPIHEEV